MPPSRAEVARADADADADAVAVAQLLGRDPGGAFTVVVRGELIPYVRLRELFGDASGEPDMSGRRRETSPRLACR